MSLTSFLSRFRHRSFIPNRQDKSQPSTHCSFRVPFWRLPTAFCQTSQIASEDNKQFFDTFAPSALDGPKDDVGTPSHATSPFSSKAESVFTTFSQSLRKGAASAENFLRTRKRSGGFGFFGLKKRDDLLEESNAISGGANPKDIQLPSSMSYSDSLSPTTDMALQSANDFGGAITSENFSKEFQAVTTQDLFEGFRVEANKQINKSMSMSHSLILGSSFLYQVGPTFASEDGSLVLFGRCGTDGTVSGRVVKKIGDGLEAKMQLNSSLVDEQRNVLEIGFDRLRNNNTFGAKMVYQGAWILNGSYSQMINPRLHLGTELLWISSNGTSIGCVGGRYAGDKNIVTAQLTRQPDFKTPGGLATNLHNMKLNIVHKVSDRLNLASELECSVPDLESSLKCGYEYNLQQSRISGLVDTSGKLSVVAQDYSGFGVSGVCDLLAGDHKVGLTLHMMPRPADTDHNTQSSGLITA